VAQEAIAHAIAMISGNSDQEVSDMTAAVQSGLLPVGISGLVTDAIGLITDTVKGVTETLGSLVGALPAVAQPPVQQALDTVTQTMASIQQILSGLLRGGIAAPDNGDPGTSPQLLPVPTYFISQLVGMFGGSVGKIPALGVLGR